MRDLVNYPSAGQTANFQFFALAALGPVGTAIVQALQSVCEADYSRLRNWFNNVTPPGLPFRVYVDDTTSGAMHYGCADTELYIGVNANLAPAPVDMNE